MKKIRSASDKALEAITRQQIKPIPKWKIVTRYLAIWLIVLTTVMISGVAMATGWYMVNQNDWDLLYIPYFWIILIVLGIVAGIASVRMTKRGYKWEWHQILAGELMIGIILAMILNFNYFGERLDYKLEQSLPYYREINPMKSEMWWQPNNGRIYGEILKNDGAVLLIAGPRMTIWKVDISQAQVKMRVNLVKGEKVKIMGRLTGNQEFEARDIRPWLNRFGN